MNISKFRHAWAAYWHQKADRMRSDWIAFVDQWEADTEPGQPLVGLSAARRNLGMAVADLYDAIGGKR